MRAQLKKKRQKATPEVPHSAVGHHLRSMPKRGRRSPCGKTFNMLCGACNVLLRKSVQRNFMLRL